MKTIRLIAALAAPLLFAQPAWAADSYPSKPVKIIVPYQAGQGTDVAARYLPASFGQDIGGDFYDLVRLDERVETQRSGGG